MFRKQLLLITNIMLLADGIAFILSGYMAWYIYWKITWETFEIPTVLFVLMILALILINALVLGNMNLYDDAPLPPMRKCIIKISVGVALEFALFQTIIVYSGVYNIPLHFMLIYMGLVFLSMILNRVILKSWFMATSRKPANLLRILLVGSADRVALVNEALHHQYSWGHQVIGWLCYDETEKDKKETIEGLQCLGNLDSFENILYDEALDVVIISLPPKAEVPVMPKVELCRQLGITIQIVPGMFDPSQGIRGLTVQHIHNVPTLTIYGSIIDPSGLFYKRIIDLAGGIIGFCILAILYPFIALAIKLNNPGPVLFKQERVGLNKRHFCLYKFRSMVVNSEDMKKELSQYNEMEGQMFKMQNDPRVTRVGRFLRRTSLDELPQFINVLKGDMSLVGTRPPTPDEVDEYEPWQRRRISMKPGITGLWQISGRNAINNFQDVVKYDLAYIDEWHIRRDIYILLKTVWVVLTGRGAS